MLFPFILCILQYFDTAGLFQISPFYSYFVLDVAVPWVITIVDPTSVPFLFLSSCSLSPSFFLSTFLQAFSDALGPRPLPIHRFYHSCPIHSLFLLNFNYVCSMSSSFSSPHCNYVCCKSEGPITTSLSSRRYTFCIYLTALYVGYMLFFRGGESG